MDESELRKNIKEQRDSLGLSAADLAQMIGAKSPQTIYDIESGKVQVKYSILLKIKKVLPDLVTGLEASPYSISESKVAYNVPIPPDDSLNPNNKEKLGIQEKCCDDYIEIPEYDIQLSAGHGAYPDNHALSINMRPFALDWLKKKSLNPANLKLVRVMGDSMEPLLKDKDIIMIDTSKTKPSEAMPFAIRFGDDLLVKTIQRLGNGSIALVSRNKDYNDIVIDSSNPPSDFSIIGAVVWHAHSWI